MTAGADDAAQRTLGADDAAQRTAGADDAAQRTAGADDAATVGVSAADELRALYNSLNPSSSRPPAELSAFTLVRDSNYFRGCKFSPDGLCLLTNSADNQLRLFNMPRLNESEAAEGGWQPVLNMPESDLIYDMCWYPSMNSADPDTCCFAACSRDNPVRLWTPSLASRGRSMRLIIIWTSCRRPTAWRSAPTVVGSTAASSDICACSTSTARASSRSGGLGSV
ncbi:hypothetical protein BOX15_Mlig002182g103 [Macrostomum lignano]|uniref:WD repeat-containing protein 79 n=1 Tax=Macrostomum lignano TaxID=282301 RepID=A0A267DEI3_9PLAT|nr:hypothetical protein BOX15_Mlig002182g103 [Macrostomum lignano]